MDVNEPFELYKAKGYSKLRYLLALLFVLGMLYHSPSSFWIIFLVFILVVGIIIAVYDYPKKDILLFRMDNEGIDSPQLSDTLYWSKINQLKVSSDHTDEVEIHIHILRKQKRNIKVDLKETNISVEQFKDIVNQYYQHYHKKGKHTKH